MLFGCQDAGRRDVLTAKPREAEGVFVKLESGDLEFGSALMQPVSTVATASDS